MKLSVKTGPAKGMSAEVSGDSIVIGRDESCDFVLADDESSRRHAEISKSPTGGYEVTDLGSRNGTLVNGRPVSTPVKLTSGEEIEIGGSIIKVELSFEEGGPDPNATKIASDGDQTRLASVLNPPVLMGKNGPGAGNEIKPSPAGVVVGRDDDCDVTINDIEVSRRHTELKLGSDGVLQVTDLGSANGTFVDGRKISGTVKAKDGSKVRIGGTEFMVSDPNTRSKTEVMGKATGAGAAAGAPASPRSAAASTPRKPEPPRRPSAGTSGSGTPRRAGEQKSGSKSGLVVAGVLALVAVIAAVVIFTGVLSGDSDEPLDASQIITQVSPSTVSIQATTPGVSGGATGSGFVYDADEGVIVTNAHVVNGGNRYQIGFDKEMRFATVAGVAPCSDLAVLKVNRRAGLESLPVADAEEISQGDTVFALGFPSNGSLDAPLQVTQGIISAVDARVDAQAQIDPDFILFPNVIQTDAAVNPGNSGGPSVNDRGELIGVNTLGGGGQNQNYAIGVSEVEEVVPQLAEGNSIGWAGFGLEAVPVGGNTRAVMRIVNVVPNTDADVAGLRPGDFVLSINNQPITSAQEYCNAVEGVENGETVPVEVLPKGATSENQVVRFPITFS